MCTSRALTVHLSDVASLEMWKAVNDFNWHKVQQSPNWCVLPEAERAGRVYFTASGAMSDSPETPSTSSSPSSAATGAAGGAQSALVAGGPVAVSPPSVPAADTAATAACVPADDDDDEL